MWTCKKCNEEIEDSFDSCWNCASDDLKKDVDVNYTPLSSPKKNKLFKYIKIYVLSCFVVLAVIAYFFDKSTNEEELIRENQDKQWVTTEEKLKENFYLEFEGYELVTDEILMTGYTGKGSYTYKDATIKYEYVGEFKNGVIEGIGTAIIKKESDNIYKDFDIMYYSGEWYGAQFHGEGTLTSDDGTVFKGKFKSGFAHGRGEETTKRGYRTSGIWEYGKFIKSLKSYEMTDEELQDIAREALQETIRKNTDSIFKKQFKTID